MWEACVNALIKEDREVMIIGDLNACAAVQDHCEGPYWLPGDLQRVSKATKDLYIKNWLTDTEGSGCLVDIAWPLARECIPVRISLNFSSHIHVFSRLKHKNIGSRLQLWHSYRPDSHHTESNTLNCCCRHPTRDEGQQSLCCL